MITAVYLWLFLMFGCFLLYLGFTKKQYFFIIVSSIVFILTAYNIYTGIVVSEHVINQTIENKTSSITYVNYTYGNQLMDSYLSNSFALILILFGLAILFIGLYYYYKNPDFDTGNNDD